MKFKELYYSLRENIELYFARVASLTLSLILLTLLTITLIETNVYGNIYQRFYNGSEIYSLIDTVDVDINAEPQIFLDYQLFRSIVNNDNQMEFFALNFQHLLIDNIEVKKSVIIESLEPYNEMTPVYSLQLDKAALNFYNIDYSQLINNKSSAIPAILGHDYRGVLSEGDIFKAQLYESTQQYQVVGFLDEGFLLGVSSAETLVLDNQVLLLIEDFNDLIKANKQYTNDERGVIYSQLSPYIINTKNLSETEIVDYLNIYAKKSGFDKFILAGQATNFQASIQLVALFNHFKSYVVIYGILFLILMLLIDVLILKSLLKKKNKFIEILNQQGVSKQTASSKLSLITITTTLISIIIASIFLMMVWKTTIYVLLFILSFSIINLIVTSIYFRRFFNVKV